IDCRAKNGRSYRPCPASRGHRATVALNLWRIRVPSCPPSDFSSHAIGDARGAPDGSGYLFLFGSYRSIDWGRCFIRYAVALDELAKLESRPLVAVRRPRQRRNTPLFRRVFALLPFAMLAPAPAVSAAEIAGRALVVDGNTIEIGS